MKLSQILAQVKIAYTLPIGSIPDEIEIEDIAIDSRLVKKNSVFFALPGKAKDGFEFIESAIKNGASLIISEQEKLLVEFLKIFYAPLPSNIYAITGTNGKTSTAEFTRQILEFLGKKSASIGTLGVTCEASIQAQLQNSSLTTPDIVSLYKNLHILKKKWRRRCCNRSEFNWPRTRPRCWFKIRRRSIHQLHTRPSRLPQIDGRIFPLQKFNLRSSHVSRA